MRKQTKMSQTLFYSSVTLMNLACVCGTTTLHAEETKRPNFLFILDDDQDPSSLDVFGNTDCDTPNLDALAKQGVAIKGAHQMGSFIGAVSTASRTMIMTGRSVWHAEKIRQNMNTYEVEYGNADKVVPGSPESLSLPVLFHNAGYETFRTCKRGNSYEPANAMFDQRYDKVNREGNDENGSTWHADRVLEYLNARIADKSDNKKPFFIYCGFSHPHDPRHGRPELLEKYGAEDVATPTKINEKTPKLPINWLPQKPFHDGHPDLRDECKVFGVMERRDEITIRNEKGKENACIENIDNQVGRILEALEKTGELDNTYIVYTADHGIAVGKHAFMGKQNLYEHTFRVPFLFVGPNIPKNKVKQGNIYLMDLLPTFCDLAGIKIPSVVDGKSFRPVVEGKQETVRDVLYSVYTGGTKPGIRCVKKGDWKLIKYDVLNGKVRETQLFNLKDNPNELMIEHHAAEVVAKTGNKPKANQVNLANDPKYKDKLAEMEALLLDQMEKKDDPYRLWNQTK